MHYRLLFAVPVLLLGCAVSTANDDKKPMPLKESIEVRVLGKVQTGVLAIGGETTGVTITAKGVTWELDLGKSAAMRKTAEQRNGKLAVVHGELERRRGQERKERWIVTVRSIRVPTTKSNRDGLQLRQP